MNFTELLLIDWINIYNKAKHDYKECLNIKTIDLIKFYNPDLKEWFIDQRLIHRQINRDRIKFAAKQVKQLQQELEEQKNNLYNLNFKS